MAMQILQAQPWPGNVRQLANIVRQLLLLGRGHVGIDHIPATLAKSNHPASADTTSSLEILARHFLTQTRETGSDDAHQRLVNEAERVLFQITMEQAGGNKTQAAKWLGITRFTLREPPDPRRS
jgi:DNA-binding NtrC family response regulator